MQLKVLSWNIWCDGDFKKISAFLRESKANIIGLQEIVPTDGSRDYAGFLSSLGYQHAIAPIGATLKDGRMITSGIFSAYPIREQLTLMLSQESGRQAIQAVIDVRGVPITVFSFHLKHTHQREHALQDMQAETLIHALPKAHCIVMGDFNATPEMFTIRRMRQIMNDTDPSDTPTLESALFDCQGCDSTTIPRTRLDYIFVSRDLSFRNFRVENGLGSDHLPISVVVEA